MKRFTLTLAAIIGFVAVVNAQTYVTDLEEFGIIYGEFTTSGHPFVYFVNEEQSSYNIYQSDFTTHVTDINVEKSDWIGYLNYDITNSQSVVLRFTQTLFNSDEHFEYIEFERELVDDHWEYTSIHIKSTNGNALWSFNAEDGYHISGKGVFKLDNKYYLFVSENNDEEFRQHLYLISQGQGLTKVETELPISVFPSIVNRSQQITVELGEGNNATEVTVVNGVGQVIKRMPVQKGQRQVTIPAQDLNSGLNVVNTRTQQGQGSCKIIVR